MEQGYQHRQIIKNYNTITIFENNYEEYKSVYEKINISVYKVDTIEEIDILLLEVTVMLSKLKPIKDYFNSIPKIIALWDHETKMKKKVEQLDNGFDHFYKNLNITKNIIKSKEQSIKSTLPLTSMCPDKDVLRMIQEKVYRNLYNQYEMEYELLKEKIKIVT